MTTTQLFLLGAATEPLTQLAEPLAANDIELVQLPASGSWQHLLPVETPSYVLIDAHLPLDCDANYFATLRHALPLAAPIVVGDDTLSVPQAVMLMEQGAVTVLVKPVSVKGILHAVSRGDLLRSGQHDHIYQLEQFRRAWNQLSEQHQQILQLMVSGTTTRGIANQLRLSTRTVDRRRKAIQAAMQVNSPAELAMLVGKYRDKLNNRPQVD